MEDMILAEAHLLDREEFKVDDGLKEIPHWIPVSISVISVLSSLYVVFTYLFFKAEQNLRRRQLMYVAVCNMLSSVSVLLSSASVGGSWCKIQGLVYMFFELASLMWMGAVASNAHFVLVNSGSQVGRQYHCMRSYSRFQIKRGMGVRE
eukprot:SAG11_NODE_288_length_11198_cov_29.339130_8_plen_149_part_00